MKRLINLLYTLVAIALLGSSYGNSAQAQGLPTPAKLNYTSYVSESITGSSESYSTIVGVSMVHERRTYDIGVILNDQDIFTGAEFVHKVFLNKKEGSTYNVNHYNTRPYLIYNFVYHYSQSKMQMIDGKILESGVPVGVNQLESPAKVITMEHYLGIGFEQDLIQQFFISTNVGLGLYLGHNDDNNKVDPLVEQRQENGFSWSLKFGFGYRF